MLAFPSSLRRAIDACPDPARARQALARLDDAAIARLGGPDEVLDRLARVAAASPYLLDGIAREPDGTAILADEAIAAPVADAELAAAAAAAPPAGRLDAVRRWRRREILRAAAADLCGLADLPATVERISRVADAAIAACLSAVEDGAASGLAVLALGKLGGRELNYSSDVDLVFLAAPGGDAAAAGAAAGRAAVALCRALQDHSAEGFLYRVDLRLRPYGSGGSMVTAAAAWVDYLAGPADPIERQAALKARAVAGATGAAGEAIARSRPLVLSGAPARGAARRAKLRAEAVAARHGQPGLHLKVGRGGIREVEFVVQALQIEAGGGPDGLASGHTLRALGALDRSGLIARNDAGALREAYLLLRTVEHRLQLEHNRQEHVLPAGGPRPDAIARTLGVPGPAPGRELLAACAAHMGAVRAVFDRLLPEGAP